MKPLPLVICYLMLTLAVKAQQQALPPYVPTREVMLERYQGAMELDKAVRNTVFKRNVNAHWLPGGNAFWYVNELKDSVREFVYVDALKGVNTKGYDTSGWHAAKQQDTTQYPGLLEQPGRWQSFASGSISPDGQWKAIIQDGNVYVKTLSTGVLQQYTTDGSISKPYGSLAWSPDSKYMVGYRITPVKDGRVFFVKSAIPNTTRGQLQSQSYRQPGDSNTLYEMYLFRRASKEVVKVQTDVIDFFDAPVLHWPAAGADCFLYERVDRGHQRFRIIEVDARTATTRNIVDEQTSTFIYERRIFTYYLPKTNEIIWSSEKDGWRHLYLVDSKTGRIKNQITKGEWVVRDIDSVDLQKREIWFRGNGRNAGEDPYYRHYYRTGFDGKHLLDLTPGNGMHFVTFSPDKRFYTATQSTVNTAPVTTLHRTADGKKVLDLETADIAAYLATGIVLPEIFHAKGRDGKTEIWGVVHRPRHLDTTRRYPVIENIYAGPHDAFVPKSFLTDSEMPSLAELGFIVVQIDGMGTANRSKAFHDVCWQNIADAGFPDRILWIKALAAKYPYVDTTRVGLYGTSAGGQSALGALLFHPEFYKAAVSSCGCHDNRIDKQWWNEQWMGYPVGPHYAAQSNVTNASKLQGELLLIVGEADTNVPPESTYRVADALIKAGKTFDFLALPGEGHGDGGAYGRKKKRDFFVRCFMGVEPPQRNMGELLRKE